MRKIVYYVAVSLDGFIDGPSGTIDRFVQSGDGVNQYFQDLQDFDATIMGRKTYEFGYRFGLQPGQPAYPHMQHYIFSDSLQLENPHPKVKVVKKDLEILIDLRNQPGKDIYLCGGGIFAGWLLENQLIDILKVKLNPILLGNGTPLFGNANRQANLELLDSNIYEGGLQIMTYKMKYAEA
jgi:dihydrofolate reductase